MIRAAHGSAIPKDGGAACHDAGLQPPRSPQVQSSPRQSAPSQRQASAGSSDEAPQPRNARQIRPGHPPIQHPSETSEEKSPLRPRSETANLNGTQTPDTKHQTASLSMGPDPGPSGAESPNCEKAFLAGWKSASIMAAMIASVQEWSRSNWDRSLLAKRWCHGRRDQRFLLPPPAIHFLHQTGRNNRLPDRPGMGLPRRIDMGE